MRKDIGYFYIDSPLSIKIQSKRLIEKKWWYKIDPFPWHSYGPMALPSNFPISINLKMGHPLSSQRNKNEDFLAISDRHFTNHMVPNLNST